MELWRRLQLARRLWNALYLVAESPSTLIRKGTRRVTIALGRTESKTLYHILNGGD